MKKYKVGFYGGKFMPFHKGHYNCLEVAAAECEKLYVVMYVGGEEEAKIPQEPYLEPKTRFERVIAAASDFDNVVPVYFDVSDFMLPDGSEDWNAEVPSVRGFVGPCLDAVYTSEPAYEHYWKSNFPECTVRFVDVGRKVVNISATVIRAMSEEERAEWLV